MSDPTVSGRDEIAITIAFIAGHLAAGLFILGWTDEAIGTMSFASAWALYGVLLNRNRWSR